MNSTPSKTYCETTIEYTVKSSFISSCDGYKIVQFAANRPSSKNLFTRLANEYLGSIFVRQFLKHRIPSKLGWNQNGKLPLLNKLPPHIVRTNKTQIYAPYRVQEKANKCYPLCRSAATRNANGKKYRGYTRVFPPFPNTRVMNSLYIRAQITSPRELRPKKANQNQFLYNNKKKAISSSNIVSYTPTFCIVRILIKLDFRRLIVDLDKRSMTYSAAFYTKA